MVTDEQKAHSEGEEPEDGRSDESSIETDEQASSAGDETSDEGWPKSWIMVTAILGIIAIIVVARLLGQSWRAEVIQPPPLTPPKPPAAHVDDAPKEPTGHKVGPHRLILDLTDVTVPPGGKHCLGADAKAHRVRKPKDLVDPCKLKVEGTANFRLEVVRDQSKVEVPIWLVPLNREPKFLVHTMLPPPAGERDPMWVAGRFYRSNKAAVVVVGNSSGEPIKLKRVRLMARGE